jgi:ribose 5-phosphate isomerase B
MAHSEKEIQALVRKVLLRTLGPNGIQDTQPASQTGSPSRGARATVTETDVLAMPKGTSLTVPHQALVTPLAREVAAERNVELIHESVTTPDNRQASRSASIRTVAIGADHGGYAMKQDLKAYLAELDYEVIDCGTHSTASVDYPDFAYAVAKLVAEGRAWRGIIVDGAGIGSCMAANKVPGVRAAMCYDHATAVNSREHNNANVLTLGGVLLGSALARQIVRTWLSTDFGGGRHARRVDKIGDIERRFAR